MKPSTLRALVNLLSVIVTIAVNAMANILPLNGQSTGQISNQFKVYFTPSGYVFAIWGIIYIALLAFCVYQLLPRRRDNPRLEALGYWFALTGVLNCAWLFAWHYRAFVLSLVIMLALLFTLIICYRQLRVSHVACGMGDRWFIEAPFSLYLGWISVATIANASAVLWFVEWSAWGIAPQVWTAIMLGVATVLSVYMVWRHRDVVYPLVLTWAFVGIAHRQSGPTALPDPGLVVSAAWIAAAASLCLALVATGVRLRAAPAAA